MSGIQAKDVVRYTFMPEVIPRCKQLFASGFGYIAFLMAQIYAMVRLLPPGHPYLDPQNIGHFGVRHVIAEAANNLVLKKENLDQILIFAALMLGTVLLVLQIAMVVVGFVFSTMAFAAGSPSAIAALTLPASFFTTQEPKFDIAFILLDQVFGIGEGPGGNNFFNSCVAQSLNCNPNAVIEGEGIASTGAAFPWPFHVALHGMFSFYSTGMLFIGILIFLYFVVVVIAETATTGTPFGQRFQNIWVPVRLVVAIGLLVPIYSGLNTGQYITLAAAKYGSGFATNAWLRYNITIANHDVFGEGGANPTGEKETLIGFPTPPDVSPMVQAMSMVHSCAFAYWMATETVAKAAPMPPSPNNPIRPYLVKNPASWMSNPEPRLEVLPTTTYAQALDFYNNADIVIRFGIADGVDARDYTGKVVPTCGDVRIAIKDVSNTAKGEPLRGPEKIQEMYFDMIKLMWHEEGELTAFARRYAALEINIRGIEPCSISTGGADYNSAFLPQPPECSDRRPDLSWRENATSQAQVDVNVALLEIWDEFIDESSQYEMTKEILDRGWGGSGIWFNKISQLNGSFMDSVNDFPKMDRYPLIMEEVRERKLVDDKTVRGIDQFHPSLSQGKDMKLSAEGQKVAEFMHTIFSYWNHDPSDTVLTASSLEAGINLIFGTQGLFAMTSTNNHVHPLAQLTMLGKGLVEASIRNVATATVTSAGGGLLGAIDGVPAALAEPFSQFILSTAFVGLTAGLVLYYILPFLPFIYFFFAVGGWVKTIFEAMVGVPLWALAHLRIDGEGLPGNSAANGYFLIFEVFIRPILSVFGLVAAVLIFTAQLRILNFIWQLVTSNLAGFEGDPSIGIIDELSFKRSIVDQFFFTVIYAMIAYMMAIACFKLVDKIPDKILRWMGASVSSFSDINQDPTEGLTKFAALGGLTAGREIAGGVQSLGGGVGRALGQLGRGGAG